MNLEIDRQELDFLIDGVAEELNKIEVPVAVAKTMLEKSFFVELGVKAEGIELFEDYIAQHSLLIKLWKLCDDKEQAKESIELCQLRISEAKKAMRKVRKLTEVSGYGKATQN